MLLSFSLAYFQYSYKEKKISKIYILLFCLKFFSFFLLLLLLINPTIKKEELQNIKPKLSVLVDDSKSISFFREENNIKKIVQNLKNDKDITDKFSVDEFVFGEKLNRLDTLTFAIQNTNISEAIATVNEVHKDKIAPILLLSDGNQTIGNDYEFIKSNQVIYPIVFGDTTQYKDLKISQLNVNKYSYIKNKFPVEVILNYEGKEQVNTLFSIYKNGKTVFTKRIKFSKADNTKTIVTNLTSNKEGNQFYTASIHKIKGEKNVKNNNRSFSVEVINEQSKILILTSTIHPDLGAMKKAIQSNKQRSVAVFLVDKFKGKIEDYQLVILYQPTRKFNAIFKEIKNKSSNFLLVSGTNTDWKFINQQKIGISKNAINQIENYGAIYNNGFLTFSQKDLSFSQFPPLKDFFGEVTVFKEYQTLLFQNINGLQTQQPLLITFEENNQKTGVLFGEGIWKWRAANFLNTNTFQSFYEFVSNLVQYLSSNKKRARLSVNAENIYPANSTIKISAFYTDKNYQFDDRAFLELTITDVKTKKSTQLPFSLVNNAYQIEVENLSPSNYAYKVSVNNQNISKHGKFKIIDYEIEEQFTNANFKKLQKLANSSNGVLFFNNQLDKLKQELLTNQSFYTIQKSIVKERNLIDWKWVLFLVISLFSVEWFIRKYYGKI